MGHLTQGIARLEEIVGNDRLELLLFIPSKRPARIRLWRSQGKENVMQTTVLDFVEQLEEEVAPFRRAVLEAPFLQQLNDGTLLRSRPQRRSCQRTGSSGSSGTFNGPWPSRCRFLPPTAGTRGSSLMRTSTRPVTTSSSW
jgi:hypothetical protein